MKYIPDKMHILFTINKYANLAKIHFRDKDVLILFISILLNVFRCLCAGIRSLPEPLTMTDFKSILRFLFGFVFGEELVPGHRNLSPNKSQACKGLAHSQGTWQICECLLGNILGGNTTKQRSQDPELGPALLPWS